MNHPQQIKSARARKLVDELCRGTRLELAAEVARLSMRQARRIWALAAVKAMVGAAAQDAITAATPLAVKQIVSLIQDEKSKKIQLQASIFALEAGAGVHPPGAGMSDISTCETDLAA